MTILPQFVRDRLACLVARDHVTLAALLDEDLIYVHANGLRHRKAQYLDFVANRMRFQSVRIDDASIIETGDVAVVRGMLKQRILRAGEAAPVDVESWCVEVWRRRAVWQLCTFQSTRVSRD